MKIGHTKGTFQVKMTTIKDRNSKDLTEAEDTRKRQEQTGELYKKHLNDRDNHDGVVANLEPDILECKVKWDSRSIIRTKLLKVTELQLS